MSTIEDDFLPSTTSTTESPESTTEQFTSQDEAKILIKRLFYTIYLWMSRTQICLVGFLLLFCVIIVPLVVVLILLQNKISVFCYRRRAYLKLEEDKLDEDRKKLRETQSRANMGRIHRRSKIEKAAMMFAADIENKARPRVGK